MSKFKNITVPAVLTSHYPETNSFDRDLAHALDQNFRLLETILDAGIIFTENVDLKEVNFTSNATPDAEDTISHGLGKVPNGYIVIGRNKAGVLYNGTTAWTMTNIYLKSNVASTTYKIYVF